MLATVGTLRVTALTLRSGQDQLSLAREGQELAREGQVTDRYTKAAEQLGSNKREVRTAAIYALERIAKDSETDRQAIRERDPAFTVEDEGLPYEPAIDIAAALTVLARQPTGPNKAFRLDLHVIRAPGTVFPNGASLAEANLRNATLRYARLRGANLSIANLSGAYLAEANLRGADLSGTDLLGANLSGANLSGANLSGADLSRASLDDANLNGADLRRTGLSEKAVRKMTDLIDADTKFGD